MTSNLLEEQSRAEHANRTQGAVDVTSQRNHNAVEGSCTASVRYKSERL